MRASGARFRMPRITPATRALIRPASRSRVSVPVEEYVCWHGLPVGSEGRSRGQRPVRLPNTSKSLPPMPRVTRSVSRVSPRNWAGQGFPPKAFG